MFPTPFQTIDLEDYSSLKEDERAKILFGRAYDYLDSHRETVTKILRNNPESGRFQGELRKYVHSFITKIFDSCPNTSAYPIRKEIVSEHYADTIEMILRFCFVKKETITKEEALKALDYLFGSFCIPHSKKR